VLRPVLAILSETILYILEGTEAKARQDWPKHMATFINVLLYFIFCVLRWFNCNKQFGIHTVTMCYKVVDIVLVSSTLPRSVTVSIFPSNLIHFTVSSTCSWTIGLSMPCRILKVYQSEHLHLHLHLHLRKIRGGTAGGKALRRMCLENTYSELQHTFFVLLFPDSHVCT
jgi:hypothetical protein